MNTRWCRTRVLPVCFLVCSAAAVGCGDDAADDDAVGPSEGGAPARGGNGGRAAAGSGTAGRAGSGGAAGRGTAGRAGEDAGVADDAAVPAQSFSFFVTSDSSKTGNLGGLTGADKRCQDLASAVGAGGKTWHAYLSAEHAANGGGAVNARDRIGQGPWYNANGALLAKDLTELHARKGDPAVFLNERGERINGQWSDSPKPNEHDVLTGSDGEGKLIVGNTCKDWTSSDMADTAQVGHSDGLGPMGNGAPPYDSWNSVHKNGGCHDTAPGGGAGKLYCFALD